MIFKMNSNSVKNILIVVLASLAIYLTERLWFDEISSHNFFYTFKGYNPIKSLNMEYSVSTFSNPYRIINSLGKDTVTYDYNDIENNNQKDIGNEVITFLLRKGKFIKSEQLNWQTILNNRCFMYDYAFSMTTNHFVESFGLRGNILTSKLKSFTGIAFIPDMDNYQNTQIIFIDEENNLMYEFTLDNPNLNINIANSISAQTDKDNQMFISSKLNSVNKFERNVFIPQKESIEFKEIKVNNPYTENSDALLHIIKRNVSNFFDNPSSVWEGSPNETYTYSDENVVVQYFDSNILVYSNYKALDKLRNSSIVKSYDHAVNFINNDDKVINDYFLSGFIESDDEYTFLFDFIIENYPILLSQSDLRSSIEVTVKNGVITKYKKLAYTYEISNDDMVQADVTFLDAVNYVLENSKEDVTDAMLCYKIEDKKTLSLYCAILNKDRYQFITVKR